MFLKLISRLPHAVGPIFLIASLCLAAPTFAQDEVTTDPQPTMAEVEQAWARGDYIFVRDGLKHLAEETGTALAQYRYGRVLVEGRGGPREIKAAIPWLENAADQNQTDAMTLLARLLLSPGLGIERNPERAAGLLERAAALGAAEAQYYLAMLYKAGSGVEQNANTAFNWLLAAAKQDYVEAQYELSRAYSKGAGTKLNPEEALVWLERAAENGHTHAQYFLARALETGEGAGQNPKKAIDWYRRAAENGLPIAQRDLGTHYLTGELVEANAGEGLRWLTTAASADDPGAMANLGYAYATGLTVEADDAKALEWYGRAKEHRLGRAMVALGSFYEAGRGVEQDMDKAVALYRDALETPDAAQAAIRLGQLAAAGALLGKVAPHVAVPWALAAAQAGDADAETWLATQAENGVRPAQAGLAELYLGRADRIEAGTEFLKQAAINGDPAAQVRLGQMHMTGDHVPLDYVTAHKWFNIAAALGHSEAVELRETANALMTPEQVAEAQAAARQWFDHEQPQPPETQQSVQAPE